MFASTSVKLNNKQHEKGEKTLKKLFKWKIPKPLIVVYCRCALLALPPLFLSQTTVTSLALSARLGELWTRKPPKRVRDLLWNEGNVGIYWSGKPKGENIFMNSMKRIKIPFAFRKEVLTRIRGEFCKQLNLLRHQHGPVHLYYDFP